MYILLSYAALLHFELIIHNLIRSGSNYVTFCRKCIMMYGMWSELFYFLIYFFLVRVVSSLEVLMSVKCFLRSAYSFLRLNELLPKFQRRNDKWCINFGICVYVHCTDFLYCILCPSKRIQSLNHKTNLSPSVT
jgi:hypothetical protein